MQSNLLKKIAALSGSAVILSALSVAPSSAEEAGDGGASVGFLKTIAENTTNILAKVNDLPNYVMKMLEYAFNMQAPDDAESSKTMQEQFALTGKAIADNANAQMGFISTLNTDQLGKDATKETLPNANDLLYSTILGQPLYTPDPRNTAGSPPAVNPPLNYIKNASAVAIAHTTPRFNWRGTPANITKYVNYYNTTMAVESYGGYILSNMLAEAQGGNALTTAQMILVAQATDSEKWFATIAAEEIGKVLRQLLMFESQSYVLMTQMLQTQKQMLAAQVMTNSMLIAANQANEKTMLSDAQGN